jgi:hypothetical protein
VRDDLVTRRFTAEGPDRVWVTDITEHPTAEDKLYLCAIKDVYSGRIVGYSMSSRMTASLAVSALRNAIARRSPAGTVVVHSDRGSPVPVRLRPHAQGPRPDRVHGPGRPMRRQRRDGVVLRPAAEERPRPPALGQPTAAAPGHHHLDRKDLPQAGDTKDGSAASRPSNTRQSTGPHKQPHPPSPQSTEAGQSQESTRAEAWRLTGSQEYVPQVTQEHLDASGDALEELCKLATAVAVQSHDPVIEVRIGHYDHGAFLTLQLDGFALLDATEDGRLQPVGEGTPVLYAVVVNRSIDNQISQTLRFLGSLVARQEITRNISAAGGDISQIDRRVAEVDDQVAAALAEQLRTEHWREAAKSVVQRARASGFGLNVRFENPLLRGDALRRRMPVLRHVYNSMEPLRTSVDRVTSAMSRAMYIEGGNMPVAELAAFRDLLDLDQMRRYVAHLLRDAFVCGNGYLAMGARRPALRLLAPESVEVLGPDAFAILSDSETAGVPVKEHVLHLRGAHQVGSEYGVSLLEPFVVLLAQREVFDRAIGDAERFSPSNERDSWLAKNRQLRERLIRDQAHRVEVLLGAATTRFAPPSPDLYFPGLEEMHPAVPGLQFYDESNRKR